MEINTDEWICEGGCKEGYTKSEDYSSCVEIQADEVV